MKSRILAFIILLTAPEIATAQSGIVQVSATVLPPPSLHIGSLQVATIEDGRGPDGTSRVVLSIKHQTGLALRLSGPTLKRCAIQFADTAAQPFPCDTLFLPSSSPTPVRLHLDLETHPADPVDRTITIQYAPLTV